MKELTRTRRLTIATIIFILILITGFITFHRPAYSYQISATKMAENITDLENEAIPNTSLETLAYGEKGIVMVDVRNSDKFNKGHLGEAVNIPVSDILTSENISFLKQMEQDSMTVILYGANQREANGPWMLLKQIGFNNIKILLGGFSYFKNIEPDLNNRAEEPLYRVEEPVMDFRKFISETRNDSEKAEAISSHPTNVTPVKREKKTQTQGGC